MTDRPQLPSEMPLPPQPIHPPHHPAVTEQPPARARRRIKIDPANDPGGQLEQLLIVNKQAHDKAGEADEEEDDAKKALKGFLLDICAADPQGLPEAIDIAADPHGRYPAYTMTLKGGKRFDSRKFREEAGDQVYAQFEVDITPTWDLREATSQRRRK